MSGVNLEKVSKGKIKVNGERYPVSKAKGNAKKYSEIKERRSNPSVFNK